MQVHRLHFNYVSKSKSMINNNKTTVGAAGEHVIWAGEPVCVDAHNDCEGVVYSWLSRKLSSDAAKLCIPNTIQFYGQNLAC